MRLFKHTNQFSVDYFYLSSTSTSSPTLLCLPLDGLRSDFLNIKNEELIDMGEWKEPNLIPNLIEVDRQREFLIPKSRKKASTSKGKKKKKGIDVDKLLTLLDALE